MAVKWFANRLWAIFAGFFVTHFKDSVRLGYRRGGNISSEASEPWPVTQISGERVRGSLTTHGNVLKSIFLGFFAKFILLLTLSLGGEWVKLGLLRWWGNAARYSQLLQLITCCPQRESSCLISLPTPDFFWKPDTCHEGKPSTWVGGWYLMLVYCCVMHNDIKQLNHLHANPWWPFPLGEGCLGEHAKEGTCGWVTVRTCFFVLYSFPKHFFPG